MSDRRACGQWSKLELWDGAMLGDRGKALARAVHHVARSVVPHHSAWNESQLCVIESLCLPFG